MSQLISATMPRGKVFEQLLGYKSLDAEMNNKILTQYVKDNLHKIAKSQENNFNADGYLNWIARSCLKEVNYSLALGLAIALIPDQTIRYTLAAVGGLTSVAISVNRVWKNHCHDVNSAKLAEDIAHHFKEVNDKISTKVVRLIEKAREMDQNESVSFNQSTTDKKCPSPEKQKTPLEKIGTLHTNLGVLKEVIVQLSDAYLKMGFTYEDVKVITQPLMSLVRTNKEAINRFYHERKEALRAGNGEKEEETFQDNLRRPDNDESPKGTSPKGNTFHSPKGPRNKKNVPIPGSRLTQSYHGSSSISEEESSDN